MKQNMQPVVMHLICAAVVLGIMTFAAAKTRGDARMNDLVLGDGSQWKYLGEQWREDEARVIQHPAGRDLHSRALYVNKAFSDVTVEFEYKAGYLEGLTMLQTGPDPLQKKGILASEANKFLLAMFSSNFY